MLELLAFFCRIDKMATRFNRRELDRNDREIDEGLEDLARLFERVQDLAADLVQEKCTEEVRLEWEFIRP